MRDEADSEQDAGEAVDIEEGLTRGVAQKRAHLLASTLGRMHDHREMTPGLPMSGATCAALTTSRRSTIGGTCTP